MKLRIGGLAFAAGVSPHTVRYYEKLNLLPRANRTYAGYRMYTEEDVRRLVFIKQAQKIGFSLVEIKQLLIASDFGMEECHRIRDLLSSKLVQIDSWLAEMQTFRNAIVSYLAECEETLGGKGGDCCPVLFELTRATNALQESAIISSATGHKSNAIKRQEKTMMEITRGGLASAQGSAGNCCDPLLFGNGLVRGTAT